jgi:hypothetical protein
MLCCFVRGTGIVHQDGIEPHVQRAAVHIYQRGSSHEARGQVNLLVGGKAGNENHTVGGLGGKQHQIVFLSLPILARFGHDQTVARRREIVRGTAHQVSIKSVPQIGDDQTNGSCLATAQAARNLVWLVICIAQRLLDASPDRRADVAALVEDRRNRGNANPKLMGYLANCGHDGSINSRNDSWLLSGTTNLPSHLKMCANVRQGKLGVKQEELKGTTKETNTVWIDLNAALNAGTTVGAGKQNLLSLLGAETLPEIVADNSGEHAGVGIDRSGKRNFPKKLFALNSERSY